MHCLRLPAQSLTRIQRSYSTAPIHAELDRWIAGKKELNLSATLHPDHLSDLYVTLPTRDGTRQPYEPPVEGAPLPYGHHLAFFHPRTPEKYLRPDGTDADFCPPEPFVRRMWAGGRIEWKKPLLIGGKATSSTTVRSVEKKGFERGSPMVFVKQENDMRNEGDSEPAVLEERTHVYLGLGVNKVQRSARVVDALPSPHFSFTYTPSATTLFRFSALTFNGHHIHLDREYAQRSEGYPERLVHGPLTALMLLETLLFYEPDAKLATFEYRALNPVLVNRMSTVHGAWETDTVAHLWTQDEDGVVGMQGKVHIA
ncbi:hypothetical protein EWM64_g6842 [Hericium alpestre]|uniref:N-terminal of MaoC-like dehydratase domain-containing protein n=1 Tax=Hericium alpestre TaxID=135208 RepID=A0A4Y9ZSF5_9AGAM|nr:hypothetical protein EWM64_g6842 [Hericium alpestre]